jgi:SH3-like domain-containing protein
MAHAAYAQPEGEQTPASSTGLPLPRFASLHIDDVNLRTGPGTRYPIEWVYRTEGLPVEITGEFDIWRRIRDWEGSEGWVHKNALTGKRTAIVTQKEKKLYDSDSYDSAIVATVESNAIGIIKSCQPAWCKVQFGSVKGYMQKSDFWGAYAQEVFN